MKCLGSKWQRRRGKKGKLMQVTTCYVKTLIEVSEWYTCINLVADSLLHQNLLNYPKLKEQEKFTILIRERAMFFILNILLGHHLLCIFCNSLL